MFGRASWEEIQTLCVVRSFDAHNWTVLDLPGSQHALAACLINRKEMSTFRRKRTTDIWINFTFDVEENEILCKPCAATISTKNAKTVR